MKRIDALVKAHTANAIRQIAKCALNVYATTLRAHFRSYKYMLVKKDILFFDLTVAVHETVYATSRVDKLALTRIEGVRGA